MEHSYMGLLVDVTDATQYATIYRKGRPIGTLTRRRVWTHGPNWRVSTIDGKDHGGVVSVKHGLVRLYRVTKQG